MACKMNRTIVIVKTAFFRLETNSSNGAHRSTTENVLLETNVTAVVFRTSPYRSDLLFCPRTSHTILSCWFGLLCDGHISVLGQTLFPTQRYYMPKLHVEHKASEWGLAIFTALQFFTTTCDVFCQKLLQMFRDYIIYLLYFTYVPFYIYCIPFFSPALKPPTKFTIG